MGQMMGIITDILTSVATEPEWILVNESFVKYLEFGLWECLRSGISAHLAGTCPCAGSILSEFGGWCINKSVLFNCWWL